MAKVITAAVREGGNKSGYMNIISVLVFLMLKVC
jgi:hypothetical protein